MNQLIDLVTGSLDDAVEKLAARAVVGRRLRLVKSAATPSLDDVVKFLSRPEVALPLGGAGVGGLVGLLADRENRLRGSLAGAVAGGALGGGAYLAQREFGKGWPIGRDVNLTTGEPIPLPAKPSRPGIRQRGLSGLLRRMLGDSAAATGKPKPDLPRPSENTPQALTEYEEALKSSLGTTTADLGKQIGEATGHAVVSGGTALANEALHSGTIAALRAADENPATTLAAALLLRNRAALVTPENLRAGIRAQAAVKGTSPDLLARARTTELWDLDDKLLRQALSEYKRSQSPFLRATTGLANLPGKLLRGVGVSPGFVDRTPSASPPRWWRQKLRSVLPLRAPTDVTAGVFDSRGVPMTMVNQVSPAPVDPAYVKELLRSGEHANLQMMKDRSRFARMARRAGGGRGILSGILQLLLAQAIDRKFFRHQRPEELLRLGERANLQMAP